MLQNTNNKQNRHHKHSNTASPLRSQKARAKNL